MHPLPCSPVRSLPYAHSLRSRDARRCGSLPADHKVVKAKERGWDTLTNGALLSVAESAAVDVLLTDDKNMRYQQNLEGRRIALVVLSTPQWPVVRLNLDKIARAVNAATPGSYTEVEL